MEVVGARNCDVALFAKSGRVARYNALLEGEETPREFFYGLFDLEAAGLRSALYSTSGKVAGLAGGLADAIERPTSAYTGLGIRPLSFELQRRQFAHARVLMSFVDGFSLTLGSSRMPDTVVRIGGFQALCDIEDRALPSRRKLVRSLVSRALRRLDFTFFLSPADLSTAASRYGVDLRTSSIFPFGVDTSFWIPGETRVDPFEVFAIGQDLNRDFATLVAAPYVEPTRIVTRLPLEVPVDKTHVVLSGGGFDGNGLSDVQLRDAYRSALCVVVPIRDVLQPSGQSVTLQAMSCGAPVILTRTRGIWDADGLVDGENCLLVPPHDPAAIASAIQFLKRDPARRAAIANAARLSAVRRFSLDRMGRACVQLAEAGLELAASRGRRLEQLA